MSETIPTDSASLLELAESISIPWDPYFNIVHCLLSCVAIRDDLGAKAIPFSRKHPLATWLACMVAVFAGGLVCAPLLGKPILSAIDDNQMILFGTISWYLVFYTPFDLTITLCKILPVKLVLYVMKEIHRVKKVSGGVTLGAKHYPGNFVIMLIIGTLKGNGAGFMKIFSRLVRGTWSPSAIEVLSPSFPTKAAIVSGVIFILKAHTELISVPTTLICIGIGSFLVYSKLASLFAIHESFIPLETAACSFVFGGVAAPAEGASESDKKAKKND
ncbi:unnamed protein product [Meganyctiphanes norvegica]|uniref:Trimeric intracellular cation channel type B n=1 Tax=Meganyctiphanes norvegica TaxID=48144 RepID=A0AAV2RC16_MEGNR